MATDGQKSESLGEDSSVPPHSENQNQNSHYVVPLPLWSESLQQNDVEYSTLVTTVNESKRNTITSFSSSPENQVHFQPNFTQIRPLDTRCQVTYSDLINPQQVPLPHIPDGGTLHVQDGGITNIEDCKQLSFQDGRQLHMKDSVQNSFQDNQVLNIPDGYTQIPGVQGTSSSSAAYPGRLTTMPSVSKSPSQASGNYGYSKMMNAHQQEQIPLSYTELISSVQNSVENSKIIPHSILDRDSTETSSTSSNLGISQGELTGYPRNVGHQTLNIDLPTFQIDSLNKENKTELAGAVPETESRKTPTDVEKTGMHLVGLFDSNNSNPGTTNTKLKEEIPVDLQQGITESEEIMVPVKLIQTIPERTEVPVQKIVSTNGKRKHEAQKQKTTKRKLRQNAKMDVSETTRAGRLRSGKKTEGKKPKRSRKKEEVETPVEYEIVKHENNVSQGETIDLESYNDILTELKSVKNEYIKLQNTLTDVEIKYNTLLSTDKNIKQEDGPELFSSRLMSTIASFFNKPLFSDIQVLLGDNQLLHAHKLILSTRSEYWGLQHLFYIDKLDLTGVRQEVGYELIKWVYTDDLDTKVDVSFMIEILQASVKYKLDGLFKRCEKGLISLININNCENLKEVAEDLNCTELIEECQQFLDLHQIAPVSPLVEDDTEEVLEDLDNEEDSDFEPNVVFQEKKKGGMKSLKGLKVKKRMRIRNKKKISSIVEKLHHKKLSEAVDVELGGKLTNRLEGLEMKARILAGEKPYQCEQCGRAFAAKGNLKRHISMHSDDKPFECGICRKGFKTNSEVKRHNIVHSGEKRFMCDICSMCFSAGSSLHRHMRIHRGEKPYQCEACGKSFRSSGDVTKHNLTHTGEKPYKCPVCSKPFSRTQHVKKHMGIHKRQLGLQFNEYPDYVKVSQND